MSDQSEDRTVAFEDTGASKDRGLHAGLVDVPRARLICTDISQVEGPLPGEGMIHLTPGGEQTVGRGETCTYPIGSRKLSRQHARIFAGVGAWGVEDLNSTNGVRVNEEKVQTAWLKHGDVVRFGPIPFRFEIERPSDAVARPVPAAAADGDGEHTMIFTGAQGAKAAEVMLKAAREAEKADDAPVAIVPTTPVKAAPAAAGPAKSKGSSRPLVLGIVAVVVAALVAGGVLYYPTLQRQREIAAVLEKGRVIERVITRARESSGATPPDAWSADIKSLEPVIQDAESALAGSPDSRELADLYARARFLKFEREFANLFGRPDPGGEFLKEASRKAIELRTRLDKIVGKLPPPTAGLDQDSLKTAADLADLAAILVAYRTFARQFPQVAKAGVESAAVGPAPTPDQIAAVESRKKEFIQYGKTYHQILTRDYRLFNGVVQEVENRDAALVGRWRETVPAR